MDKQTGQGALGMGPKSFWPGAEAGGQASRTPFLHFWALSSLHSDEVMMSSGPGGVANAAALLRLPQGRGHSLLLTHQADSRWKLTGHSWVLPCRYCSVPTRVPDRSPLVQGSWDTRNMAESIVTFPHAARDGLGSSGAAMIWAAPRDRHALSC